MGYRTEAGEICFTLAEYLSTSLYDSFSQHIEYIVSSQSLPSPSEGEGKRFDLYRRTTSYHSSQLRKRQIDNDPVSTDDKTKLHTI